MRYTLRLFGLKIFSFDVEKLVYEDESVELDSDTELADENDSTTYGFALPNA